MAGGLCGIDKKGGQKKPCLAEIRADFVKSNKK